MEKVVDVAIIGGGINGCGCAADAALRGLSVVLCEKSDLASQTSSSSTKLIHGGLRYLEQFNFSLVKKSLDERQTLLTIAPHLVHPIQLILPQALSLRSTWRLRVGLFIYDHLSRKNRLPKSCLVTRKKNLLYFHPLLQTISQGFSYYDGMADDARLTIANALQAKEHGADIHPHTEVIGAFVENGLWQLKLQSKNEPPRLIRAKTLINATGPWVESVNHLLSIPNAHHLTLVKGSHLVLTKLYEGDQAYGLQTPDNRIVFTLPYFGHTLVGTTDVPFNGQPDQVTISNAETDYLLEMIGYYFGKKPTSSQIITTWSGVRPLLADSNKNASTLSRDYVHHFTTTPAPAVTIYGGKITTYRRLSEEVMDQLRPIFPNMGNSTTQNTLLPGAEPTTLSFDQYDWLDKAVLNHYIQTYGSRTHALLAGAHHPTDLGQRIVGILYQREVDYLMAEEWATSLDDILWRRTKLGLSMDPKTLASLMQNEAPGSIPEMYSL